MYYIKQLQQAMQNDREGTFDKYYDEWIAAVQKDLDVNEDVALFIMAMLLEDDCGRYKPPACNSHQAMLMLEHLQNALLVLKYCDRE